MGQEGKPMSQSEAHNLGHSRRKNIFTNTPSHSELGSQNGSRIRNQEPKYARSVMSPVHNFRDEDRSQVGSNRS